MDANKTPQLQNLKYSSLEDVQFTTPKSMHRALDGKIVKSSTRSRLRKNLANPRKLFDSKTIVRGNLFSPEKSEKVVKEAFDRCNVVVDTRSLTTSHKGKEDKNEFIDLRCTETFLDESTHEKPGEREKIDQLNNLLNYMEDLSTDDIKDRYISYRKNCTPPSRAGERRNGALNYYTDGNNMDQS